MLGAMLLVRTGAYKNEACLTCDHISEIPEHRVGWMALRVADEPSASATYAAVELPGGRDTGYARRKTS